VTLHTRFDLRREVPEVAEVAQFRPFGFERTLSSLAADVPAF